jgi:phenylpropionate dioxygenase-like ring-hydroxylating dioxygenase large terminal subunit
MKRETQLELARVLHAYVRSGAYRARAGRYSAIPFRPTATRPRAQLERERLFRGQPLFMGLSCRLPNPGDYLTEEIAGVPLLLVRGQDGKLRAFANICRHRGAPVASGCGQARVFACPYHGWTYSLDGKLAGILRPDPFPGVDKASHGLAPMPAGERHGMIFVRLMPGAPRDIDVDAHLSGLGEELDAYQVRDLQLFALRMDGAGDQLEVRHRHFLEAYHLPALHRTTVAPLIRGNLGAFNATATMAA